MDAEILSKLGRIYDPELGSDIVSLGMVRDAILSDGILDVHIMLTISGCPMRAEILRRLKEEFHGIKVQVTWGEMDAAMRQETMKRARMYAQERAPGTRVREKTHVVALASGKGGVGKSTLAVDLCYELKERGYKVGLLDADVWGHSAPILLDSSSARVSGVLVNQETLIEPMEKDGIQVISVGLMMDDPESSLMWRGAMLGKAFEQMIRDVHWSDELDYLVIDMPPGTGDVMMTLSRMLSKARIYLVTNPTELASKVAKRLWDASIKSNISVSGVVENLSYMETQHRGETITVEPFGNGGGEKLSKDTGEPLVAKIAIGDRSARLKGVQLIADDIERKQPVAGTKGCAADMLKRINSLLDS